MSPAGHVNFQVFHVSYPEDSSDMKGSVIVQLLWVIGCISRDSNMLLYVIHDVTILLQVVLVLL